MAFPTTPVLDSGTTPVENPITTNGWTGPMISGQQPLQRTATGITRGSAVGGSYLTATYGPDCEAYATIAVLTALTNTTEGYLYARTADLGGVGTLDGYFVNVRASSTPPDRMRIGRTDNAGADVVLGTYDASGTLTIAVGDSYGIQIIGDQLTGWYKVGAGAWTQVLGPFTDATYSAAGNIGLQMTRSDTRLTNFGGGTVSTGLAWLTA